MNWFRVGFVIFAMVATTLCTPISVSAASPKTCPDRVLGITTWYKGLQKADPNDANGCLITTPSSDADGTSLRIFIIKVALNVVQALMGVVAYVTIFFIIKGGFNYMTSTGSSDGMQKAKTTIKNAVIGLVIALLSASIVNAIGGAIK